MIAAPTPRECLDALLRGLALKDEIRKAERLEDLADLLDLAESRRRHNNEVGRRHCQSLGIAWGERPYPYAGTCQGCGSPTDGQIQGVYWCAVCLREAGKAIRAELWASVRS